MDVAVVGCGVAGKEHLAAFRDVPDVRVVAVCDTDDERARAAATVDGTGSAVVYTDWRELLAGERYDLVSVCVPTVAHHDVTVAALEAGAHVYCEKPFAMSLAEARAMYAAATAAGRTLGVGFPLRFMAQMREAHRIVEDATLGRVVSARARALGRDIPWWGIHWQREISGGGFVASTAVHVLDAALWVAGFPSEPTRVSASFAQLYPEKRKESAPNAAAAAAYDTEDTACAHIRFADGSWLVLDGGWLCDVPREESTVEVVGVQGAVSVDPFWLVLERDGVPVDATPAVAADDYIAALATGVKDAAARVREGRLPFVPGHEVLAVQAIVDAIYRSAEAGHEVEVEAT